MCSVRCAAVENVRAARLSLALLDWGVSDRHHDRASAAVVGGGALGLAAAVELAQAGEQVIVIERERQLGGLAAGFQVEGTALEKFYHHIFRTDTTIIRMIRELGLEDRLVWGRPNTSTLS